MLQVDDAHRLLAGRLCHDHGTVYDPTYGESVEFDFEARPEVAVKAEGRAKNLRQN